MELVGLEMVPVLPNCQPANNPTPKTMASSAVNARSAPVRSPLEGRVVGVDAAGGGWNYPGAGWCDG